MKHLGKSMKVWKLKTCSPRLPPRLVVDLFYPPTWIFLDGFAFRRPENKKKKKTLEKAYEQFEKCVFHVYVKTYDTNNTTLLQ